MTLGSTIISRSRVLIGQVAVFMQWENENALENYLEQDSFGRAFGAFPFFRSVVTYHFWRRLHNDLSFIFGVSTIRNNKFASLWRINFELDDLSKQKKATKKIGTTIGFLIECTKNPDLALNR